MKIEINNFFILKQTPDQHQHQTHTWELYNNNITNTSRANKNLEQGQKHSLDRQYTRYECVLFAKVYSPFADIFKYGIRVSAKL